MSASAHCSFVMLIAVFCGGCTTLPALEGGRVSLVSGGTARPAVDELAKIDLAYQLDPKRYGHCHERTLAEPLDAPVRTEAMAKTAAEKGPDPTDELRCALEGFYSPRYFDELTSEQKKALEVSNVTFAYAEKQANRIGDLSRRLDEVSSKFDATYRASLRSRLQTVVLDTQVEDLTARVRQATESSAFLEFQRRRRNGVQAAFMSASDAACDLYKRNLNNFYSTSNFSFGSVATIAGGLGAAVTGEATSRALAAIAGTTSGIRAEYNDAFFRNKVVEVLTKAVDISRTRKKEEIRRRSAQVLADYSMEDALGDAILYNSQCSLVAGLQETSESLQTVSDPGLKWLANAFGGAASDKALTTTLFEALGKAVGTVQAIQKSTEDQNAVVGNPSDGTTKPPGNDKPQ